MRDHLEAIVSRFDINGSMFSIDPLETGHIHDTYHVVNEGKEFPDYLLQRINSHVFKDIPALMRNIRLVTGHIHRKLEADPSGSPGKEVLTLVPVRTGEDYFLDDAGSYWRMYYFLDGAHSCNIVQTAGQAYEGGKAFGKFLAMLSDLDSSRLHDTIPRFHDIESRYCLLKQAVGAGLKNRINETVSEMAFVENRIETMSAINRSGRQGLLPRRITHNDTKFNNVMFNGKGEAQCVVDLDTVMPGYLAFDFGDAVRTIVNPAKEDERDLGKIKVDLNLFEGFAKGFLSKTIGFITDPEIDSLSQGVLLLPFLMGVRFLTDYLDGDRYYKISFPGHNLQRARAQFRLVEKLEEKSGVMQRIIRSTAESLRSGKADG